MMLTSNSARKQKSILKKSLKSKSNKKNMQKILKHQEKPQLYISKFQFQPSNKDRNKDLISEKMKTNNINNNYPSMNNSSSNINIFNEEKYLKDCDVNSTFTFTGNNEIYIDNNKIIENYLKKPQYNHLFECKSISTISNKEENEIKSLKNNSFTLNTSISSLSSKTMYTNTNNKVHDNNELMKMLIKINTSTVAPKHLKDDKKLITKIDNNLKNAVIKRKKVKSVKVLKKKEKKSKIMYYVLFIFLNILIYVYFIINMFEPSVEDLFYDNDHNNYIYTTSLLSQDRSLVMNK